MQTILFRPDLAVQVGVGHVMRSMALGEALLRRGVRVVFACRFEKLEWVKQALVECGFATLDSGDDQDVVSIARSVGATAVVIDSYTLPTSVYQDVRRAGFPLLSLVDNLLRGARGDLLLDQNIGAERDWADLQPLHGRLLAGLEYALIRQEIRRQRPAAPPHARDVTSPRILVFFGGSDATGLGPAVAELLSVTPRGFDATLITRQELVDDVRSVRLRPGQAIEVLTPVKDLSKRVREADLVIAAAGSSSWELAALGAAVAAVPVAENQMLSCARLIRAGASAWLGSAEEVRRAGPETVAALTDLLAHREQRQRLHEVGWSLVDGLGAERAAKELLSLIEA